jgi:hypothetical protein
VREPGEEGPLADPVERGVEERAERRGRSGGAGDVAVQHVAEPREPEHDRRAQKVPAREEECGEE